MGQKIDDIFLKDLHARLMFNTTLHIIIGTSAKVAQPYEVQSRLDELLEWYYGRKEITLEDIASFHYKFEIIHPFQDGNVPSRHLLRTA